MSPQNHEKHWFWPHKNQVITVETSKNACFVGPLNLQPKKRIHSIQVMTTSVMTTCRNFYMGVSKNRCTPKTSVFNGVFHKKKHPFWGTVYNPQFLETPHMGSRNTLWAIVIPGCMAAIQIENQCPPVPPNALALSNIAHWTLVLP